MCSVRASSRLKDAFFLCMSTSYNIPYVNLSILQKSTERIVSKGFIIHGYFPVEKRL